MRYVKGDITSFKNAIIIHGCNAQGVMGSGVALAIKTKWPQAYKDYASHFSFLNETQRKDMMGKVLETYIKSDNVLIMNAITQFTYGRSGTRYMSYDAIDNIFKYVQSRVDAHMLTHFSNGIVIPKIGSALGGGNWNIIEKIINENLSWPLTCVEFEG